MFMRVASLYDATAFAWGFCRASHHSILVKREWVTKCVVKSSGFLVVFVFLFTRYTLIYLKFILDTPTVAMSFYFSLDFIWDFGLQILTRLLPSLHIGDKQVDAYIITL